MPDKTYRGRSALLPALPVEWLGLSVKSRKALRDVGVSSIDDLIANARIAGLGASQKDCRDEIDEAFRALLRSASDVDWDYYRQLPHARGRGFPIVPRREARVWSGYQFVQEFPKVVREVVQLQFGPSHSLLVRRRTLKSSARRWTLARVGGRLGVSRERVSTIEKRIVLMLRRSLLEQDYRRLRFRFRPAFVEPLRRLQEGLRVHEKAGEIRAKYWRQTIHRVWELAVEDIADTEPLILEILQLRVRG